VACGGSACAAQGSRCVRRPLPFVFGRCASSRLGVFGQVLHAIAPRVVQIIMDTTIRMFPDSDAAAKDAKEGDEPKPTADQMVFANLMRGLRFPHGSVLRRAAARGGLRCLLSPSFRRFGRATYRPSTRPPGDAR